MANKFYPREQVQQVLAETNIAQLIGQFVKLKNQTNHLIGLCPFHQEKTPSFSVNPEKQFYHCFGCGVGGNAIDFLMRYQNLDFVAALEALAQFAGVSLESNQIQSKHQLEYELNQKALDFFRTELLKNASAQHYLKKRGVSEAIQEKFAIGYAPDSWDSLKNHLNQTNPEMISKALELGLLAKGKNQSVYDKYRDRIMFPIRNPAGKVVGFGGRVLNQGEPKYLNSPQSPIFSKSNELYGLFELGRRFQIVEQIVMVEGYMDVVALFNHEIDYALASLGTAINKNHLTNLSKITRQVVFCFDGDLAGKNAAIKGIEVAMPYLSENFNIQLLWLPDGEDPDTFIQKHTKFEFQTQIKNSQNWADFLVQQSSISYDIDNPVEKERLIAEIRAIHQKLVNPAAKRILIAYASSFLKIEAERLEVILDPQSPNNRLFAGNDSHNEMPLSQPRDERPSVRPQGTYLGLKKDKNPVQFNKRTKLRLMILVLIFYPEVLEKCRTLSNFLEYYQDFGDENELKKWHQKIAIYIQPEYISAVNLAEVEYLIEILNILEEQPNLNPAMMLEALRSSNQFQSYFEPLMANRARILLIDRFGNYDTKQAANDFLDSLLSIIRSHEKIQTLAKLKLH